MSLRRELNKKYTGYPTFKSIALEGYRAGQLDTVFADKKAKAIYAENKELRDKVEDLRRCLNESNFYL